MAITSEQTTVPEWVRQSILEYLGIEGAQKEKQDEIIATLGSIVLQEILLAVMERLGEEGQKTYDEMMRKGATSRDVEDFFRENITNYDELIQNIVGGLMEDMKNAGDGVVLPKKEE